jgi:hypothetical protein
MILIHNPAKINGLAWILTKKLHNCSLHSLHLKVQEWKSRMVMGLVTTKSQWRKAFIYSICVRKSEILLRHVNIILNSEKSPWVLSLGQCMSNNNNNTKIYSS